MVSKRTNEKLFRYTFEKKIYSGRKIEMDELYEDIIANPEKYVVSIEDIKEFKVFDAIDICKEGG